MRFALLQVDGALLHLLFQLVVGLLQLLLDALAVGDVAVDLQHALPAVEPPPDVLAGGDDHLAAVPRAMAKLPLPVALLAQRRLDAPLRAACLPWKAARRECGRRLLLRIPVELLRAAVPALDAAVHPPDDDGIEGKLQELRLLAERLLALPQRLLLVVRRRLLPAAAVQLGHHGEESADDDEKDEPDVVRRPE